MTFASAFDKWLEFIAPSIEESTAKARRYNQARFFEWARANRVTLTSCRTVDITAYMAHEQARGVLNNTLKVRIQELRAFFEWAIAEKLVEVNPMDVKRLPKLKGEDSHKVPFTEGEWRRAEGAAIVGDFSDFWPAAMGIAYHTGLRISDVSLLKWESVLSDRLIVFPRKRRATAQRLEIPLVTGLKEMLASLPRTEEFVLPEMAITYLGARSKLEGEFRKICDAAGLPDHSFHSFRHGLASRLINAGVDSLVVSSITGQTLDVLKGYAHISQEAKMKALTI